MWTELDNYHRSLQWVVRWGKGQDHDQRQGAVTQVSKIPTLGQSGLMGELWIPMSGYIIIIYHPNVTWIPLSGYII